MTDPLVVYVSDHLSGAQFAIELLQELRNKHSGEPLASFASEMLPEVEADTSVLQHLADRLGSTGSGKKVAGWVAEKASRAKLRTDGESLGTFERLELLTLGILGKLALWQVLTHISPGDTRFAHLNLSQLVSRAETQHALAEKQRLHWAKETFRSPKPDG